MSNFSPVNNVRIKSLTVGAVVQLRLGKTAVKNDKDDVIVDAKLTRNYEEGEKSIVVFEEADADGNTSELVITQFPGATWRADKQYVSLVAVDPSTYTVKKTAEPINTDVLAEAMRLVADEKDDFYAADKAIALFDYVLNGTRVGVKVKELVTQYAHAVVAELKALPPKAPAAED